MSNQQIIVRPETAARLSTDSDAIQQASMDIHRQLREAAAQYAIGRDVRSLDSYFTLIDLSDPTIAIGATRRLPLALSAVPNRVFVSKQGAIFALTDKCKEYGMLECIQPRPTIETPCDQLIESFCDPASVKPLNQAPFYTGKFRASTDGRMAFARLDNSAATIESRVADMFNSILSSVDVSEPPQNLLLGLHAFACGGCQGHGLINESTCHECRGAGTLEFETNQNSYTVDCKTCDGNGSEITVGSGSNCPRCTGYGYRFEGAGFLDIQGALIDPNYWRLIESLPGLRIGSKELTNGKGIYFEAGELRGVIAGMRLKKENINDNYKNTN